MLFGKQCPACGRRNPANAVFCNVCGERIVAARKQPGCLRRTVSMVLLLAAGIALLAYLAEPHDVELDGPVTSDGQDVSLAQVTPYQIAPSPTVIVTANAALSLTPGLHVITYAVVAAADDGGAARVVVDYLDAKGMPAHHVGALPWEYTAQLTPGLAARLVAAGPVGQAFIARIYVDGKLVAEEASAPVAMEEGAAAVWRAWGEALPGP